MRYGSVCSGIEAATIAWRPLGWHAAWFSEIEKFPSAVLAHHYPDVPNLGDMTTISRRVLTGSVEAPEILVGGTPCQAFSVAGLREGMADARGQLTISYVRLLDAIDFIRERRGEPATIAVWENVPGVLSDKTNAFGCFLGGLAGEDCELVPPGKRWANAGCVYGPQRAIAWRTIDAQYFGLAQRRRRVFVIASARKGIDPGEILFERDGVRRDSPPSREAGKDVAAGTLRSTRGGSDVDHARANQLVAFGGNNQTGPIDVATAVRAKGGTGHNDFESETFIAECVTGDITHTLKADGHDGSEDGTGRGTPIIAFSCKDHGANAALDVSPTLRAMNHSGSHANAGGQMAVAIHENQRAEITLNDTAGALNSGGGKPGQGYPAAMIDMAVRRLTPMECERLQGDPDNYTLIKVGKKLAQDGPRYKSIGNSMATHCMRWIGNRIDVSVAKQRGEVAA